MTRDEQKKWRAVSTDEQAQEFIDLFWARRDPTPGTYVNEYKQEYDARVKYAFAKHWSAELSTTNLGDKRYENAVGYDAPRRGAFLQVSFQAF